MFKNELVAAIAKTTKITQKNTESTLDAFVDIIAKALNKGEEVKVIGFGIFKTVKKQARDGRNPRTGAELKIPARTAVKFVPGSKLVRAVR